MVLGYFVCNVDCMPLRLLAYPGLVKSVMIVLPCEEITIKVLN